MIRQLMSYYVDENATLERSRIEQYFEVSLPYCVFAVHGRVRVDDSDCTVVRH